MLASGFAECEVGFRLVHDLKVAAHRERGWVWPGREKPAPGERHDDEII
jgi:hypothetical protein